MEIDIKKNMSVNELIKAKKSYSLRVNHEYQRGSRWSEFQKQMFIDSIMRGYSVPAFYFHETEQDGGFGGHTNKFYDIIDGQQRIEAVYEFSEDSYQLLDPRKAAQFKFPNFVKNKATPWAGKRFSDFDDDMRGQFLSHPTVVYFIKTDDDNEVRDLFIRLQAGTPLTPQDKRDAWPGNFTEFVLTVGGKDKVSKWYGWELFKLIKSKNDSSRRSLVAQSYMLFHNVRRKQGFCYIKNQDIDNFYHEHIDFDPHCEDARMFKETCDLLAGQLKGRPKLFGFQMIDLILYTDSILRSDYVSGWEAKLPAALHEFNERCRQGSEDNRNDRDTEFRPYFLRYTQWGRVSSDTAGSIRKRQEFFAQKMDELVALAPKDDTQAFTDRDRERIFYRDDQHCQHCAMEKQKHRVDWEDAEIHHVNPHHAEGKTSPDNGALVHRDCHLKAQTAIENFRMWWESERRGEWVKEEKQTRKRQYIPRDLPPDGTDCRWSHDSKTYLAEIRDRRIHSLNSEFLPEKTFTSVIRQITGISRNGWDYWEIRLPETELWVLAAHWRKSKSNHQNGLVKLSRQEWDKEFQRLLDAVRVDSPETTMENIEAVMIKKHGPKPSD